MTIGRRPRPLKPPDDAQSRTPSRLAPTDIRQEEKRGVFRCSAGVAFEVGVHPRRKGIDAGAQPGIERIDPSVEAGLQAVDARAQTRSLRVDPGPQRVDPGAQVVQAADEGCRQQPDRGPRYSDHLATKSSTAFRHDLGSPKRSWPVTDSCRK